MLNPNHPHLAENHPLWYIWRCPEMVVPPVIIHLNGIVLCKPCIWGAPIYGNPHLFHFIPCQLGHLFGRLPSICKRLESWIVGRIIPLNPHACYVCCLNPNEIHMFVRLNPMKSTLVKIKSDEIPLHPPKVPHVFLVKQAVSKSLPGRTCGVAPQGERGWNGVRTPWGYTIRLWDGQQMIYYIRLYEICDVR